MAGPDAYTNTTDITDVVLNTYNVGQSFTILNSGFDGSNSDMSLWSYPLYYIESNDYMHHGVYTVTQTITIPGYAYTFPETDPGNVSVDPRLVPISTQDTATWTLTMNDPCRTTTIVDQNGDLSTVGFDGWSIDGEGTATTTNGALMVTSVLFGTDDNIVGPYTPVTYSFPYHEDTTSISYASTAKTLDMFICRERTYSIDSIVRVDDSIDGT
jgi:hypothetical protein